MLFTGVENATAPEKPFHGASHVPGSPTSENGFLGAGEGVVRLWKWVSYLKIG
jgi:hypothetical protein